MNTNIWLVRHGETEWNIAGRFQGCKDIPLTEVGLSQAKALKYRFNNNFDAIYTSPLTRAIHSSLTVEKL